MMRLSGSRAYYRPTAPKMPPGLVDLMEGLTREVLKQNPADIYGFCASHMELLLEKRDGPTIKKTLPLEKKIARAQEKVRQRAEARRQEYDNNLKYLQQNVNTTLKDIQENVQVKQETTTVANCIPTDQNKDKITSSVSDEIAENIIRTPVYQEQALNNLAEMEFSHSGLDISESRYEVSEIIDCTGGMGELDNNLVQEKPISITSSSTEPTSNVTDADNTTNEMACIEIVNKEVTNEIALEAPKSHETVLCENRKEDQVFSDKMNVQNVCEIVNIHESTQLDTNTVGIDAESGEVNTASAVMDSAKESQNDGLVCESTIAKLEGNDGATNDPDSTNRPDSVTELQSNQSHGIQVENPDQVSNSSSGVANPVHVTNAQSPDDIMKRSKDDIRKIDGPVLVVSEPTDVDIMCDKDQKPDSEKEIENKCDDDNSAANNDDVYNSQALVDNVTIHDNTKDVNTPPLESNGYMESLAMGVDHDIPTLVTENSMEIKTSANEALELYTTFDKTFFNTNLSDNIINTEIDMGKINNPTQPTEMNNEDNTVGEISPNLSEKNTNMDLETAAITIQKVFRNFLFKSRGSTFEETVEDDNDDGNFINEDGKNKEECDFSISNALNIDRRAHGITRMDTVLQTVNEEKSLSLSTDDSSTLSSAATIIQAHVRGFLVRNRLNSNKTLSSNSLPASYSYDQSMPSLEAYNDNEQVKNKTVLNIHIVPEGENSLSRDESLITSIDLSLDSSPPSSINLHPLGYDKSERRKQLKREDAIQSVSPPSNHSGKLSEDFDSVKELSLNDHDTVQQHLSDTNTAVQILPKDNDIDVSVGNGPLEIISKTNETDKFPNEHNTDNPQTLLNVERQSLTNIISDENDVVTPFTPNGDLRSSNLMHSGEFHDAVLPTRMSRSDTTVVSGE